MENYILGISAFYHDSAAVLLKDGEIIFAAQEERYTRKKHDHRFPFNAIDACLKDAKIEYINIDLVVFYEKPFLKFERLIETYLSFVPKGFISFKESMPIWSQEKLFQKNIIEKNMKILSPNSNWENKILFSDHHMSHAASAFYPSPYKKALVLIMDGVGESATTSVYIGENEKLELQKEIKFPSSLGLLYSAFTYFTGFKVNSGEYKLMGLAPYGNPKYAALIKDNLIDIKDDGSFCLNQNYFDYCTNLKMTNKKFNKLFGSLPRKSNQLINQFHMDLASSIQSVTEEIILKILKSLSKEYNQDNLCLAGGVALNCVANGKILKSNIFKKIWIQPAAGDAGGALGAALTAYHYFLNKKRNVNKNDCMKGSYLGSNYENITIKNTLGQKGAVFSEYSDNELINETALLLTKNKSIGWFQGKMEFGPRALGGRSILADPRNTDNQSKLNLKIKFRESFRPFAPSILEEDLEKWFDISSKSPYMLFVANVLKEKLVKLPSNYENLNGIEKINIARSIVPAITHLDFSARIQTVNKTTNLKFYNLIKKFKLLTDCPILINTSFNVRGEPIVNTPEDAFNCFMGTGLDCLVIGNYILLKEDQNPDLIIDYKNKFELD